MSAIKLKIIAPDGRTAELEVSDLPAAIGRDRKCPVHLDDRKASRCHARIELRDGVHTLVDLGSSNGTFVNGRAITERALRRGDELTIGKSLICVMHAAAADRDPPAPPGGQRRSRQRDEATRAQLEDRLRRRRRLGVLGPVVALFSLAALGALWLLSGPGVGSREPARVVETPALPPEIAAELHAIQSEVAAAPRVNAELLAKVSRLELKYRDVEFADGARPFANLNASLRIRHRLETGNRIHDLIRRRDGLLEAGKYGEALRVVRAETDTLLRDASLARPKARRILEQTEEQAQKAYTRLVAQVEFLEKLEFAEECLNNYEKGLEVFAGTSYGEELKTRRARFQKRLVAAQERSRLELVARREAARRAAERRRAETEKEATVERTLSRAARLAQAILAREPAKRPYRFSDFEGRPLGFRAGEGLVVETSEGERVVSATRIPPQTLAGMALDALEGDSLLEAASFAYEHDLGNLGDRLLLKYVRRKGSSPGRPDPAVNRLLAAARGLGRVPEGGFTYASGHGWEDAKQRAERTALDEAVRLSRRLAAVSSEKALKASFSKLRGLLADETLSGTARVEVRNRTIASLGELRQKLVKRLTGRVNQSAYARLRLARIELNRRRKEAVELIYDRKRYLPENHPDYGKGDEVNGQVAVDKAVAAVRELWDNAGDYAVAVDPRTSRLSDMIQLIDATCFPELRHRPPDDATDSLQEIRNNLDRVLDLRRFASDRAELDQYLYNRKVEAYNQALEDPDLAPGEKAHVAEVNDYREMLGRRRLFIDVRLCRATGKHSKACSDAGRIWHHGPDGSPGSRARAEGFPAPVAENVAIGYASPKDIWFRGWYRASDHHRNGLGGGWSTIGYGYAGNVGTQNFASIGAPFR